MSSTVFSRRKQQNLLLIARLVDPRHHASPFTLILDSIDQSAKSVVDAVVQRAAGGNVRTIFVSFETIHPPLGVDDFVPAEALVVVDSLNALADLLLDSLSGFLSSLIRPRTSLLAVYHTDVVVASPTTASSAYAPHALTLLEYLSTSVLTVHCLAHVIAQKRARDRSLAEPRFGLAQQVEGLVVGRGANDGSAMVLEMEHRRKSGRAVEEWFVMTRKRQASAPAKTLLRSWDWDFSLLEEHPSFRIPDRGSAPPGDARPGANPESTFDLTLNEKQRADREHIMLPYFDAQRSDGGTSMGGRILYDMGAEDDFDDEEDEI
ncbi:MAG: hypothetical protein M1826_002697 [Phylliscum demangeonii]|nr:MAG: hypothetical protein M1826_002697 [Phylliscum demangeonii]